MTPLPEQISAAESSNDQAVERLLNLGMSQVQIDEIRQTRKTPTTIKIVAPADGLVRARNISSRSRFDRGSEWYRIAALDRVCVVADVFEDDARYFKPGMEARVSPARGGDSFVARVSDIPAEFDAGVGATRCDWRWIIRA